MCWLILALALSFTQTICGSAATDTTLLPVKNLRLAIHVFQDENGMRNFHPDSTRDVAFLNDLVRWANHRLSHLDSLKPAFTSPYVADSRVQIRIDTVYYHRDSIAWNCSKELRSPYMRDQFVDSNPDLDYRAKYQTLPVFIGANYAVIGGHSRNIGDRGYIAVRGYYEGYRSLSLPESLDACGRNLVHELGHCLGLLHNFSGLPDEDQCDDCEDNGCPPVGTSNNIMDYWPAYGHALSKCQFDKIHFYLNGGKGNISEIVIRDSCFQVPGLEYIIAAGDTLMVSDTVYLHGPLTVGAGGVLRVTGYLSVPGDQGIRVEPGGVAEVDGGTIGNLCGDLWQGIQISGSKEDVPVHISIRNNGTLENARTGLLAGSPVRMTLNGAVFSNCVESLVAAPGCTDSIRLENCTFQVTTKLNHYEEGVVPESFVRVNGVGRLEITGCTFINQSGTLVFDSDWMGTGLIAGCRSILISASEFNNLTTGIYLHADSYDSKADIVSNRFLNNKTAVYSLFGGIQLYGDNEVVLQRYNAGLTTGFLLMGPDRFSVTANRFRSLYGGGKLAGLVVSQPGTASAAVFFNRFANLPVGIFQDGLPDIEPALFRWAEEPETEPVPGLGPQYRENQFDTVDLEVCMVADSTFGSAFGYTGDARMETEIPASGWYPANFLWYADSLDLVAFNGWKEASSSGTRNHALHLFMNYPELAGVTGIEPAEPGDPLLAEHLRDMRSALLYQDGIRNETAYAAMQRFARLPAAARSPLLSEYLTRFDAWETTWLQRSLASIASRFTKADTLLSAFGSRLAADNLERWQAYEGSTTPDLGDTLASVPPAACELPVIEPFRFAGSGKTPASVPGFVLLPSPTIDFIYIRPKSGYSFDTPWTGQLVSAEGRRVQSVRIESWEQQRLSVEDLPTGLYILELFSGNQYLGAAKFVKSTLR